MGYSDIPWQKPSILRVSPIYGNPNQLRTIYLIITHINKNKTFSDFRISCSKSHDLNLLSPVDFRATWPPNGRAESPKPADFFEELRMQQLSKVFDHKERSDYGMGWWGWG